MLTGTLVARCGMCGTCYDVRAWPWLEPLDDDRRTCAVPGCGAPVERAPTTALRLAAEGRDAANDTRDTHRRGVSETMQKTRKKDPRMTPEKAPKKPAREEAEAPAIISIRGVRPEDHAAFERGRARISAQAGGAFVSLSQAVLVLARRQAAREDAEEAARAAARRSATIRSATRKGAAPSRSARPRSSARSAPRCAQWRSIRP